MSDPALRGSFISPCVLSKIMLINFHSRFYRVIPCGQSVVGHRISSCKDLHHLKSCYVMRNSFRVPVIDILFMESTPTRIVLLRLFLFFE